MRKHTEPLQPPTLAAFLPWGSSEGAGRTPLTGRKNIKGFLQILHYQALKLFHSGMPGNSALITVSNLLTGCVNAKRTQCRQIEPSLFAFG